MLHSFGRFRTELSFHLLFVLFSAFVIAHRHNENVPCLLFSILIARARFDLAHWEISQIVSELDEFGKWIKMVTGDYWKLAYSAELIVPAIANGKNIKQHEARTWIGVGFLFPKIYINYHN